MDYKILGRTLTDHTGSVQTRLWETIVPVQNITYKGRQVRCVDTMV